MSNLNNNGNSLISLEDREQIRTLIARYNHAADEGLIDAWADLFTEDGEWHSSIAGHAKGKAELRDWLKHELSFFEGYRLTHFLTNTLFLPQSSDIVRARSHLIMTRKSLEDAVDGDVITSMGGEIVSTAVLEDIIQRTENGWKFKVRNAEMAPEFDPAYLTDNS